MTYAKTNADRHFESHPATAKMRRPRRATINFIEPLTKALLQPNALCE